MGTVVQLYNLEVFRIFEAGAGVFAASFNDPTYVDTPDSLGVHAVLGGQWDPVDQKFLPRPHLPPLTPEDFYADAGFAIDSVAGSWGYGLSRRAVMGAAADLLLFDHPNAPEQQRLDAAVFREWRFQAAAVVFQMLKDATREVDPVTLPRADEDLLTYFPPPPARPVVTPPAEPDPV